MRIKKNLLIILFLELQLCWQWPDAHMDFDDEWQELIKIMLVCLDEVQCIQDIGNLIIKHLGIASKIMKTRPK